MEVLSKSQQLVCPLLTLRGHRMRADGVGTSFLFHPGLLPGGRYTHTCHPGRSIGYYLEVLIPLAPFGKTSLDVILNGVTGEEGRDMTVSHT